MRRQAHVFLAAGDENAGIATLHGLRGQMHCLEAAAADLVDGQRRNRVRQTARQCGLARRVLANASLEDLTENDLVNLPGLQIGPRQQGFDHMRAKLARRNSCQRPVERADCGASCGHNDYIIKHRNLLQ